MEILTADFLLQTLYSYYVLYILSCRPLNMMEKCLEEIDVRVATW